MVFLFFFFFKILFLEEMDSEPQQLNAISYTLFIGHSRRIHVGCEALFKKAHRRDQRRRRGRTWENKLSQSANAQHICPFAQNCSIAKQSHRKFFLLLLCIKVLSSHMYTAGHKYIHTDVFLKSPVGNAQPLQPELMRVATKRK